MPNLLFLLDVPLKLGCFTGMLSAYKLEIVLLPIWVCGEEGLFDFLNPLFSSGMPCWLFSKSRPVFGAFLSQPGPPTLVLGSPVAPLCSPPKTGLSSPWRPTGHSLQSKGTAV